MDGNIKDSLHSGNNSEKFVRNEPSPELTIQPEELNIFFSFVPALILITDLDGHFIHLNHLWEQVLGYSLPELKERSFFDFIHPDDLDSSKKNVLHLVSTNSVTEFTNRYRCRDDEYHWFEWTASLKENRIYALGREITRQKMAEDALRKNEEQLKLLIKYAPAALAMFDRDMRYLTASQRWISDYHIAGKDITGLSHYEVFPEISEDLKNIHKRGLAGETISADDDLFRRSDGSSQWVKWEVRPWYNTDSSIGGIVIFSEDVTLKKWVQKSMELSNKIYQIANQADSMDSMLKNFVTELQSFSGCEAVGIRLLDKEGNIPYQAYTGFPSDFYEKETPLSIRSDECMCISVIKGVMNANLPVSTENGSFFCNATTKFLATVSEEEKGHTRNVCNQMGYESVALIPIRTSDSIIGLVQFNDSRENMVPVDMVKVIEEISLALGETIRRMNTENSLHNSESLYRSLFENMLNGYAYCQMIYQEGVPWDFRYLKVNRAFAALTGLQDVDGKNVTEVIPGFRESDYNLIKLYAQVSETGEPAIFETYVESISMWFSVSVFSPQKGYFVAIFDVITERKKTEELLKQSEAKYRKLYESIRDALVRFDMDGKILDFNQPFKELLGYPEDTLKKLAYQDITPDKWHPVEADIVQSQVLTRGYSDVYEKEFLKSDGTPFPAELRGYLIRDDNGKAVEMWAIVRDISERKLMEAKITDLNKNLEERVIERTNQLIAVNQELESEIEERARTEAVLRNTLSLLNATFESTADGLLVTDLSRVITGYNANFEKMFQISDLNATGKTVTGLFTQERIRLKNRDHFTNTTDSLYQNPHAEGMDVIETEDGKVIERYTKPQKIDETIVGRVFSFRDVTGQKRMEEQIIESLKEKEILLKEIHHRVKNNMQVIASLLFLQAEASDDEKVVSILKESQSRVKSMALVHEKLYRSESLSRIDYLSYLEEFIRYLFKLYTVDRSLVTFSVSGDKVYIPISIASPLSLIIHEIISNSLKHAFPQGTAGSVHVQLIKKPPGFHLILGDDGVGFSESVPFEKNSSMGLKLIAGLSHQIHAGLSVSKKDGTEYTLVIPLEKE